MKIEREDRGRGGESGNGGYFPPESCSERERERERIKDRREENHGIGGREEGKEMKTVENSRERKPESLRA